MTLLPAENAPAAGAGDQLVAIEGRPRDLGGFSVRRVLPSGARRMVGPFIFFDHIGPTVFAPGGALAVRPHPHINLETVTYLFDGEIVHRDSLGSHQVIRPGAVNWMTAGRGIVHSERTDPAHQAAGARLHGIQCWVALPKAHEEVEPAFHHHPAGTLPSARAGDADLRVVAGSAYGARAPVRTFSPLFFVEARLPAGGTMPLDSEHDERGVYVVEGEIFAGATRATVGTLLVFPPGTAPALRAASAAHLVVFGGAPLDGERHIFWNFVSSSPERIERAKRDWKELRFPVVPGDESERIPLPE